ncbi:MAG: hypothetical protein DVB29_06955 [Verrucomicrobia bacterium]|nr:MAG: hypothetical protein DVB29_06955 [Verrucomicrobiota bacterium]
MGSFFLSLFYGSNDSSNAPSATDKDPFQNYSIKQVPSKENITIGGHSIPRKGSWSPLAGSLFCKSLVTSILGGELDEATFDSDVERSMKIGLKDSSSISENSSNDSNDTRKVAANDILKEVAQVFFPKEAENQCTENLIKELKGRFHQGTLGDILSTCINEKTQDFVFIQGSPSSQWLYSPHKEGNKIDIEATYTFNKSDDNLSAIYDDQPHYSVSHSASGETKLKLTLSVDPEKGSISQIDVTSLLLNWEIKDKPTSASLSSQ